MDIRELIDSYQLNFSLQYTKWLDVKLSHFFYISSVDEDINRQKKIAKKSIEVYRESGEFLLYLSSNYYIDQGKLIPIFLTPVFPDITKDSIHWMTYQPLFTLNSELGMGDIMIELPMIDDWIDENRALFKDKNLTKSEPALYFNLNSKKYIQRDIELIKKQNTFSYSIQNLSNDRLKLNLEDSSPDFLSLLHSLPLDYSQAKVVSQAKNQSLVIQGPPGTGKSQTIINLALEEIREGKRVAILSKKKVALDVLLTRFQRLNIENFVLNLTETFLYKKVIASVEEQLFSILEYKESEISVPYNEIYFRHGIRIMEDYFIACKKHQQETKLIDFNLTESFTNQISHSFFQLIYPRRTLITAHLPELSNHFIDIQNKLVQLEINFQSYSFDFLLELAAPFRLLEYIDKRHLAQLIRSKSYRKEQSKVQSAIKSHLKSKPLTNSDLYKLGLYKLEYFKSHFKENNFLQTIFDRKWRETLNEISSIDNQWNQYSYWEKLLQIDLAIERYKWEIRYKELELENRTIEENLNGINIETLHYIEGKLQAKIPIWQFAWKHWIIGNGFESKRTLWHQLFELLERYDIFNQPILSKEINWFLKEVDIRKPLGLDNESWVKLCSMDFQSFNEWKNYLNHSKNEKYTEPVLKNYTLREIIRYVIYIRKNYHLFGQYQLKKFQNEWLKVNHQTIVGYLNSRKQIDKSNKLIWKPSIQFIQKNWSKKRKIISLYEYIQSIDIDVLLSLKPITIATFEQFSQLIPLKAYLYDTLIIDESSQVELIESLPALHRAKKVIVVGDRMQLTPTRFFVHRSNSSTSYESLLELAEEKLPSVSLNYHYRSKYAELIEFSNQNFYQNKLNSTKKRNSHSLQWRYIPEGVYHQRKNKKEASCLIDELGFLSHSSDNRSIGIITFSMYQKDEIEHQLELAMMNDSILKEFIDSKNNLAESFFVKSIEHVQGDERDIILISSGYGRNPDGNLYQFFGPILSFMGENRLNVLMSRARETMIFLSSIRSSDVRVHPHSPKGLIVFKKMFEFLENSNTQSKSTIGSSKENYWEYFLHPFRSST